MAIIYRPKKCRKKARKNRKKPKIAVEAYNAYRKIRNGHIQAHPLCEDCLKNGKVTAAEEVHHIKPFMSGATDIEKMALAVDPNNLVSLCHDCHMKRHKKKGGG